MGYTLTFSAPPALQGFAAYYGGQQAAQRQTDDTQARIDAQNDAQLNNMLAATAGQFAQSGLAGYYYNQAQQAAPGTYAADGMGPPAPGDPAAYQRNMMLAQYALGGPQAASGYLANQEQFRNRMIAQNDAQSFSGEQNRLNREQNQTQFDARLKFREADREDSQQFQQDYLQQQVAGRLNSTPQDALLTGQEIIMSQGGDPSTMPNDVVMAAGLQELQRQQQIQTATTRTAFTQARNNQAANLKNFKVVQTKDEKAGQASVQHALSAIKRDDRFIDPNTGQLNALGIKAQRRLEMALPSYSGRMEYQEPPPSLGETLGIIQPVPAQGPPTPSQVSPMGVVPGQQPSSGQFQSPYGEVLVNGTGVAAIQLPNGKMMTFHNDGQKVNMRVEDVKTPQSGGFTPGETVELDGVKAGIRKENGDVSWYPEYVMDMANPQKARQSGKSGGGAEKDKSLAVNTYFKAMSQKKDYEMSDGSIEARSVSEAEARDIAVNALEFAGGYERSQGFDDIQEPAAKRNALRAKAMSHAEVKSFNSLLPQGSRPVPAREIVDGTVKVLDRQNPWDERRRARLAKYLVEANLMDEGDIPGEIAGEYLNLAEAQDAARNQGGQPYERPFKKTKDGPTYVGLYDPATGKVTNERLLKQ